MTTTPKPREHLHSSRCLAHALICAVENLRDEEGMTDYRFRLALQDGAPLWAADDYLASGWASCLCDDTQGR